MKSNYPGAYSKTSTKNKRALSEAAGAVMAATFMGIPTEKALQCLKAKNEAERICDTCYYRGNSSGGFRCGNHRSRRHASSVDDCDTCEHWEG